MKRLPWMMLLAAALALLPVTTPAIATTISEVQRQIILLINAGEYDEAIAVADAFEPGHPNHAARVNFVRGMVAKAKGNNREAAQDFRQVLADQPDLTPARQQLAHALFLDGDYDAARHHFEVLQSATNDPRLKQLYAAYESAIDREKPWSLGAYVTLAPSTNINRGANGSTYEMFGNNGWVIPKDQQKQSGLGVAAGGQGSYVFRMEDGMSVVVNAGADGRFYTDHEDDSLRLNASVKPAFETQNHKLRVAAGPTAAMSFSGYERTLSQYGIEADVLAKLDQGLVFAGSVSALFQDFDAKPYRNGEKYDLDARLIKSLSESVSVGVSAGLTLENAKDEDFDHLDWQVGLNGTKEWEGGWMTRAEVTIGKHDYEGVLAGKTEAREDWAYSAGLQLANRQFSAWGFMPVLNYTYTRQTSNDEFSSFDSHDLALTLTRGF